MYSADIHLCHFCAELVQLSITAPGTALRVPHHSTYASLSASGNTCPICRIIISRWQPPLHEGWKEPSQDRQDEYGIDLGIENSQNMSSGVSWVLLKAELRSTLSPLRWVQTFTLVICHSESKASTLPAWGSTPMTIEERISTIGSWLQECRLNHKGAECNPLPCTPLRLMTVGLDGTPPKLVWGNAVPCPAEYATLSYVWGGPVSLCTTRATLKSFSEQVPLALMPKTLADALQIARALKIPYIWIDALCIVQDDEKEWQTEAARMGEIYQGSQLTIAAAQSPDASHGCLLEKGNHGLQDGESFFRTCTDNVVGSKLLVRLYQGDIRTRASRGNCLSTRGWTLQEHLLSRRLVSCMQPEVHWQCQACYRTESGLSFDPESTEHRNLFHPSLLQDKQKCHAAWQLIVNDYSRRDLTYSVDRLPALAGIIRHFVPAMADESILGLWKSSFAHDLAWLRLSKPTQVPALSTFPSWSWLSCPGSVFYGFWDRAKPEGPEGRRRRTDHVKLLDYEITWSSTLYTSQIKSAYVQVEGPVRDIRIRPFAEGSISNPPYFQVFDEDLKFSSKTTIPWRCVGQFDAGEADKITTYTCLLLFSDIDTIAAETDRVHETFLILEHVGPKTEKKYKRLGLGKLWGNSPTFDLSKADSIVLV
ncbi:heterokaryon incompatibility protein-domain-containing protein [Xylariales sp. PMI_506]|nr:heterokaryon incompatibility protein-domain-containing protein [Xylariales sp. PMI_506]